MDVCNLQQARPNYHDKMSGLQPDSLRKHRQTVLRDTAVQPSLQIPSDIDVDQVQVDHSKIKNRISSVPGGHSHRVRANSIQRRGAPPQLVQENGYIEEEEDETTHVSVNVPSASSKTYDSNPYAGMPGHAVDPYANAAGQDKYGGVQPGAVVGGERGQRGERRPIQRGDRDDRGAMEAGDQGEWRIQSEVGHAVTSKREKERVEKNDGQEFRSKDFDATRFISKKLGDKTDVEIAQYAERLALLQEKLNSEREQVMYDNYQTFLKVGLRIDKMNVDVEVLRKSLRDLHHVASAVRDDAQQYLEKQRSGGLEAELGRNDSTASLTSSMDGEMNAGRMLVAGRRLNVRKASANVRSSVLMLEDMWQRDLKELFRHVDGAQRYLPIVPGRHIVAQRDGFYFLNNATWKSLYSVHIFVLSDHVLIGARKRQPRVAAAMARGAGAGAGPGASSNGSGVGAGLDGHSTSLLSAQASSSRNLVAENCWPISDIDMFEVFQDQQQGRGGNGSRRPALCIKHNDSVYMYKSDQIDAQQTIVHEFRKCKQELAQLQQSSGSPGSRRQSSSGSGISSSPSIGGIGAGIGVGGERGATSLTARGSSLRSSAISASERKAFKQYEQIISDLDLKIAYRQLSAAVEMVIQYSEMFKSAPGMLQTISTSVVSSSIPGLSFGGTPGGGLSIGAGRSTRAGTLSSYPNTGGVPHGTDASTTNAAAGSGTLLDKFNQRVAVLTDVLVGELERSYNSRQNLADTIGLLLKLHAKDIAAGALLETRHLTLKKRIKQVEFQGDTLSYVSQVAIIAFRTIRTSVELYQECFGDTKDVSALVEWASNEVNEYVATVRRHVNNLSSGSAARAQCCDIIERESKQLAQTGLDFSFLSSFKFEL